MMDKYLKFTDSEEAESVLFDKAGDALIPKSAFTADVIGVIYKKTGVVHELPDGLVYETAAIPGWHVNVRGVGVEDFAAYEVEVKTPERFWA